MALPSEYYENVRFKRKLEEIAKTLSENDKRMTAIETQLAELIRETEDAKKALLKVLLGE